MFDMSWGEVMVIGGVALIVIGPKDLPKALRTVGQMTTKVRRLASEFQSQFNEAMREAELDEVRREVEGLNRQVATATTAAFNPLQTIRDELKGAVEAPPQAVTVATAVPAVTESTIAAGATAAAVSIPGEAHLGEFPLGEGALAAHDDANTSASALPDLPPPGVAAGGLDPFAVAPDARPAIAAADTLPAVEDVGPVPQSEPVLPAPRPHGEPARPPVAVPVVESAGPGLETGMDAPHAPKSAVA